MNQNRINGVVTANGRISKRLCGKLHMEVLYGNKRDHFGQITYEVTRFYKKGKTMKDVLSERILLNLAAKEQVDEPPRKAVY